MKEYIILHRSVYFAIVFNFSWSSLTFLFSSWFFFQLFHFLLFWILQPLCFIAFFANFVILLSNMGVAKRAEYVQLGVIPKSGGSSPFEGVVFASVSFRQLQVF